MRDILRYEHRTEAPLPQRQFVRRMVRHGGFAGILVIASVAMGTCGYMTFAGESAIDGFLNASMLLGGMGPVGPVLESPGAKLFAAFFALYSGLVFLIAASLVIAPVFHRVLHRFHWEEKQ